MRDLTNNEIIEITGLIREFTEEIIRYETGVRVEALFNNRICVGFKITFTDRTFVINANQASQLGEMLKGASLESELFEGETRRLFTSLTYSIKERNEKTPGARTFKDAPRGIVEALRTEKAKKHK